MNPPTSQRKSQTLTEKQQEAMEQAKARRFARILAALSANEAVRDQAVKAEAKPADSKGVSNGEH